MHYVVETVMAQSVECRGEINIQGIHILARYSSIRVYVYQALEVSARVTSRAESFLRGAQELVVVCELHQCVGDEPSPGLVHTVGQAYGAFAVKVREGAHLVGQNGFRYFPFWWGV